jgi:hypothetical protein
MTATISRDLSLPWHKAIVDRHALGRRSGLENPPAQPDRPRNYRRGDGHPAQCRHALDRKKCPYYAEHPPGDERQKQDILVPLCTPHPATKRCGPRCQRDVRHGEAGCEEDEVVPAYKERHPQTNQEAQRRDQGEPK